MQTATVEGMDYFSSQKTERKFLTKGVFHFQSLDAAIDVAWNGWDWLRQTLAKHNANPSHIIYRNPYKATSSSPGMLDSGLINNKHRVMPLTVEGIEGFEYLMRHLQHQHRIPSNDTNMSSYEVAGTVRLSSGELIKLSVVPYVSPFALVRPAFLERPIYARTEIEHYVPPIGAYTPVFSLNRNR